MAIFNKDMIDLAGKNDFFQKEVYRDANIQIVLMSIPAGEDIGMETHRADQSTFFVEGEGQAVVDGTRSKVEPNSLIVIPKGAEHSYRILEAFTAVEATHPPAEVHDRDASPKP